MASGFGTPTLPRFYRNSGQGSGARPGAITAGTIATHAPRIPWDKFTRPEWFTWKPGEHVGLIGPTGQGKTTLLTHLLPLHRYVIVLATKPEDESMDALIRSGYEKFDHFRGWLNPDDHPRQVIWPDARSIDSETEQRAVFGNAMARIYRLGRWTVAIDELWYFTQMLDLGRIIKMYYLQARSLGISLIAGTQRPAWVPREMYTSCTHLFFWRSNDEEDLRSISGIGATSANLIREVVSHLDQYEALYINTRTDRMARVRVPKELITP